MIGAVRRDERERAVDADADRITAAVLSFGLLVLVLIRSMRGEAAWDLLALVVAGGAAGMVHRLRARAVDRRYAGMLGVGLVVAAIAAALVVALVTR